MVIELAKELINKPSITPNDSGCQNLIASWLQPLGFKITELPIQDVNNLWATFGDSGPLFVFAGHTDVVPPGPLTEWSSPPFAATIRDNYLFGRGAADMKSSVAAMLVAVKNFLQQYSQPNFRLGFLITSDEEGKAEFGTKAVVEYLKEQNININYCLIGEASSEETFGDTIKIGRRGSLSGDLTIFGKQGHIAYPQLASNPIHLASACLSKLCETKWDEGTEHFQKTQFQISNIHSGTGANNVIPGSMNLKFNFRYAPCNSAENLQTEVEKQLNSHNLNYKIEWHHSGKPFYREPNNLVSKIKNIIQKECQQDPKLSTGGGTSDGRFLIDICDELIEFGPVNKTIHKIDECINLHDLQKLTTIYQQLLVNFNSQG